MRRRGPGAGDEAQRAAADGRAEPAADVERAALAEREHLRRAVPDRRAEPAGGRVGERLHGEPRERGRERGERRHRAAGRRRGAAPSPPRRRAPPPRRAAARASAARWPPPPGAARAAAGSSPARSRLRANAGEAFEASSRQASPRASQYAAVCSRVTSSSGRTSAPSRARHPEERAAAGRGGEPVEHGLDLVGRGVAGGDVAAGRELRRGGVAGVARPRLEVPRARGPARAAQLERHAEPLAQRRAVRGVVGRLRPQPVVAVQRGHRLRARDPHREVEQADAVAPAREEHHDRAAGREQAARADGLEQVRARHSDPASVDASGSRKIETAEPQMRDPAVRGQCGPLPRPAAFVVDTTPCGRPTPPTSRPIAVVRMRTKEYRGFRALSTWRVRIRPRDADTRPRSSRGTARRRAS